MERDSTNFKLQETVEQTRRAEGMELEALLHHRAPEVQAALLENPRLQEQHLFVLLSRRDLSRDTLTAIARNGAWMRGYSLKFAVAGHPQTPVRVARPLLKFLYFFDLLRLALSPGISPQLKRLAEDAILFQKEGLAIGQRISLARRASSRLAAGLLDDSNAVVIGAALSNPSLTEQSLANALLAAEAPRILTDCVVSHPNWSARHPIKLALARSRYLSLGRLMEFLSEFSVLELQDLFADRRVADNIRHYALRMVQGRRRRTAHKGAH